MSILNEENKNSYKKFVCDKANWFNNEGNIADKQKLQDIIDELNSYEVELKKNEFDKAKTSLSTFKNINDEFKIFTQDEDYKN
jgi:hypothetical protein